MNILNEERAVAALSELIALQYGASPVYARQIGLAAALHDIGKVCIPAYILKKPGKLNTFEFEVMKTHTSIGAQMLSSIQGKQGVIVRTVCMYHHEWYDGRGGYWGKRSGELPHYVPYVSIADVFIALISERVYKHAWPLNQALEYIHNQSGTQFSPELTQTFISLVQSDIRAQSIIEIHNRLQRKGEGNGRIRKWKRNVAGLFYTVRRDRGI